jgi:hypothetical protein
LICNVANQQVLFFGFIHLYAAIVQGTSPALISIVLAGFWRFQLFLVSFVLKVLGDVERPFCAKVPVLRGTAKLAPGGLSAPGAK